MYDFDGIFALNEASPVTRQLLTCADLCKCEAADEKAVALLRAQVKAVLLYT